MGQDGLAGSGVPPPFPPAGESFRIRRMKPNPLSMSVVVLVLLATSCVGFCGEHWPQFRGPTGLGYTEEKNLPLQWGGDAKENVLWKSPLIGAGACQPDRLGRCGLCLHRPMAGRRSPAGRRDP